MIGFTVGKNGINSFLLLIMLVIISGLNACMQPDKKTPATGEEEEKVVVKNFGQALFSADPWSMEKYLDNMSSDYHFFIGEDLDSLNIIQLREFLTDPFNRELAAQCEEKYPGTEFLNEELTRAFANVERLFPGFRYPEVYTYVSGLLYEYPVQYVDTVLIIALDMFLGWDYEPYRAAGIPVYITRRMEKENITPECCRQIAYSYLPDDYTPKILLDHMILHGKILHSLDLMLPGTPDHFKIGYSPEQLKWCSDNERLLWKLFIDREILFSTDAHPKTRFIQDGPFTAGLPEGAPAMLGRWIGWQIVRSYMRKNPGTDLKLLFEMTDSQQLLSKSGYKPKK